MPHDTALLIIDVQRAMCEGDDAAFDIDAVVERINALSDAARTAGRPVVLVQHEEAEGPLEFDTEYWDLADDLQVMPADLKLRKTTPDSFHQTPLQSMLEARGIRHVVVCGLQSEYCVDSTVRGALSRGYGVTLAEDAHTTMDNGVLKAAQIIAHHNTTLGNLGSYGPRVRLVSASTIDWS